MNNNMMKYEYGLLSCGCTTVTAGGWDIEDIKLYSKEESHVQVICPEHGEQKFVHYYGKIWAPVWVPPQEEQGK